MTILLEKWQRLLTTVRFQAETEKHTRSVEELNSFELRSKIHLPSEYKAFCQVFGSGAFGSYLTIYCPDFEQIDIEYLKEGLEDSKDLEGSELAYRIRDNESIDIPSIEKILDSAFVFGGTNGGESIIWDLKSYDAADDSYDIYMTRVEDFPGLYKIGRDFFEFIQLYGLGIGSYSHLPEWTQPSIHELDGRFTPFTPMAIDDIPIISPQ